MQRLEAALGHWIQTVIDYRESCLAAMPDHIPDAVKEQERVLSRRIIQQQADEARPYLAAFLQDNSDKTAAELEEIAAKLSPGGAHDGALLVSLIRSQVPDADPLLIAAVIKFNWQGGRAGFQHLPDPAEVDPEAYFEEVMDLHGLIHCGTSGDPRRLLTGCDLEFYDSLPDRVTVWRGCSGIGAEKAALGMCWTTDRAQAEWFATRWGNEPVLLKATISKEEILLAFASESEVVAVPQQAVQVPLSEPAFSG